MSIAVISEFPGATLEQYEAAGSAMDVQANPPAGILFHAAGVGEGVLRLIEVWESQEALDAFVRDRQAAALRQVGAPEPRISTWPVHTAVAAPSLVPQQG